MMVREVEEGEKLRYIQNGTKKNNRNIYFWRQVLATLSSMIATVGVGITFSFTGTWISNVQVDINLTDEDKSWLATTNIFSMIPGTCLSWCLHRTLGSKISLLLMSLIWILGWYILSVAPDFVTLLAGCFIVGLASGFNNNIAIDYLVEIPEPRLRGAITVFSTECSFVGVFLGHLSGIKVPDWRMAMQLCALAPILTIVFTYWSPESQYWLLKKNRIDDARNNFFWLRGKTPESKMEFDEILSRRLKIEDGGRFSLLMKKFTRNFLWPFFISLLMFSTVSGSGSDVIITYAEDILKKLSSEWNPEDVIILMDLICIICCGLSCFVIKKVSRRSLFFSSCLGQILSLLAIIVGQVYNLPPAFLTIVMCVYMAVNSLGLNPIVWLVPAEIFPEATRDVGVGASTIYYYFITLIFTKFTPTLINNKNVGMQSVLWIFISIMTICSILLYFIMPETKDITLEEVQERMNRRKFISVNWRRKK